MSKDLGVRKFSFWNTDMPIVSERVKIIMSNNKDSKKLVDAIRSLREGDEKNAHFTISEETNDRLKKAQ